MFQDSPPTKVINQKSAESPDAFYVCVYNRMNGWAMAEFLRCTLVSRELETHHIETQLEISLSFPVENRNSLAWVLPTLSACPTYTGRRARLDHTDISNRE